MNNMREISIRGGVVLYTDNFADELPGRYRKLHPAWKETKFIKKYAVNRR